MIRSGLSLDQAPPLDIPLRFFLSVPFFGALAGVFILLRGDDLFFTNWDTETIVLTHLITLGWITMAMFGAFYQMVPVLIGGSVPYIHVARLTHGLLTAGIVLLVPGLLVSSGPLLGLAVPTLFSAFAIFIFQLSMALIRSGSGKPTAVAMKISIASLAATVLFGLAFAGIRLEWWDLPWDRFRMTGAHLTLGLFGWVGSLIMGVGFHVIHMFYITEAFPVRRSTWILRLHILSLILIPVSLLSGLGAGWVLFAALPGLTGALVFTVTIFGLLNRRKRKVADATLRFWQCGLVSMPFSLVCLLLYQFADRDVLVFLFGIPFLLGFAASIINGMLYKILPFLVWFHRFSPLIGKIRVPLIQDIAPDKEARRHLYAFMAGYPALAAGTAAGLGVLIRAAGLALAVSSVFFFLNLYKAAMIKIQEP